MSYTNVYIFHIQHMVFCEMSSKIHSLLCKDFQDHLDLREAPVGSAPEKML